MRKSKKKYLYIVVEWGKQPTTYATKIDLVNHFGKDNSRIVDGWFEDNWFHIVEKYIVVKVEVPKIKSKSRR